MGIPRELEYWTVMEGTGMEAKKRPSSYHLIMSAQQFRVMSGSEQQELFSRIFIPITERVDRETGAMLPCNGFVESMRVDKRDGYWVVWGSDGYTYRHDWNDPEAVVYLQFRNLDEEYERLHEIEQKQEALTQEEVAG